MPLSTCHDVWLWQYSDLYIWKYRLSLNVTCAQSVGLFENYFSSMPIQIRSCEMRRLLGMSHDLWTENAFKTILQQLNCEKTEQGRKTCTRMSKLVMKSLLNTAQANYERILFRAEEKVARLQFSFPHLVLGASHTQRQPPQAGGHTSQPAETHPRDGKGSSSQTALGPSLAQFYNTKCFSGIEKGCLNQWPLKDKKKKKRIPPWAAHRSHSSIQ